MSRGMAIEAPTGLLRVLTTIDFLFMALLIMGFGLKGVPVLIFSAYAFPNTHLVASVIVILAATMIFSLMYARFSGAVARSGGDYVYVSRFLHPALGFASNLNIVFINVLWLALSSILTAYTLVLAVAGIGVAANSAELVSGGRMLLRSPYAIPAIGFVVLAIYGFLSNLSIRAWRRLQIAAGIIGVAGMLAGIGLLAITEKSVIAEAIANTFGRGKATLLQLAYESGYNPEVVDPLHVVGASAALGLVMLFSFYPVYMGGEASSRGFKAFASAMIGASLITAGLLIGFIIPVYGALGREFPTAIGSLLMKTPSNIFLLMDYYILMLKYLAFPPAAIILLAISPIAWAFMLSLNLALASSRCIFAWSLDGLAPLKLSYVTKKWRAPLYANLVTVVAAAVLLLIISTNVFLVIAFFGSTGSLLISMFLTSLTAIKASLKGELPSGKEKAMPVLGAASAILTLLLLSFYVTNPRLGFIHPLTLSIFAAVWAAGLLWYYIALRYRRARGQEITELLKKLPPG